MIITAMTTLPVRSPLSTQSLCHSLVARHAAPRMSVKYSGNIWIDWRRESNGQFLLKDSCNSLSSEVSICCLVCRLLGSAQWHERKEGLMSLQYYVQHIKSLTPVELRRVTEVFTRMFHDPHAKVCFVVDAHTASFGFFYTIYTYICTMWQHYL